jgi:hypothetical protein
MFIDAKITATRPRMRIGVDCAPPATRIAPIKITPWMALAPDISGVCKVEDTLEITSIPTKIASTKIVSQMSGSVFNCSLRSLGSRSEAAYFVVARRRKRRRSLLLSTAARNPMFNCSLRSLGSHAESGLQLASITKYLPSMSHTHRRCDLIVEIRGKMPPTSHQHDHVQQIVGVEPTSRSGHLAGYVRAAP